MKHARQTIREAAAAALSGITGAVITTNRLKSKEAVPGIVVRTGVEVEGADERDSPSIQRRYDRLLTLVFVVYAAGADDVEDLLDDYAAQIEAAVGVDGTLGGKALETVYQSTNTGFQEEGEGYPLAYLELEYRVWYRTTAVDPETSI